MLKPQLHPDELAALSAVLGYWEWHWDLECPTLFGLELKEYRAAAETWRATLDLSSPQVAYAMLGALREFLHGATAVKADAVSGIAGMSCADLANLNSRIRPYVLGVVARRRTA